MWLRSQRIRHDRAEVGVGTLIIFIAMVLVAAVAASVIIGTSGELQSRAQATGKEATAEVSSNLRVLALYGARNSSSADVYDLKLHAQLAAGAVDLDLTRLIVRYSDGSTAQHYNHSAAALSDGAAPQTWFVATWIRGGTSGIDVMKAGDLVEIHFNLYGLSLDERQTATLQLVPESGAPVALNFRAPNTYATSTVVRIA